MKFNPFFLFMNIFLHRATPPADTKAQLRTSDPQRCADLTSKKVSSKSTTDPVLLKLHIDKSFSAGKYTPGKDE